MLALAGYRALAAAGFAFTLGAREDRLDPVAVVRLLISLRVVVKVAREEQAFVNATGDALYDVDRHMLAGLLVCELASQAAGVLARLPADGVPGAGPHGRPSACSAAS